LGDGRNKFQILTGYAGVGAVDRGLQGEVGSTRTSLNSARASLVDLVDP
jgi:hypothetical protein